MRGALQREAQGGADGRRSDLRGAHQMAGAGAVVHVRRGLAAVQAKGRIKRASRSLPENPERLARREPCGEVGSREGSTLGGNGRTRNRALREEDRFLARSRARGLRHRCRSDERPRSVSIWRRCASRRRSRCRESRSREARSRLDPDQGVGVVVKLAEGKKCARSWRITLDVGSDKAYPELSARDAAAMREIDGKAGA